MDIILIIAIALIIALPVVALIMISANAQETKARRLRKMEARADQNKGEPILIIICYRQGGLCLTLALM